MLAIMHFRNAFSGKIFLYFKVKLDIHLEKAYFLLDTLIRHFIKQKNCFYFDLHYVITTFKHDVQAV